MPLVTEQALDNIAAALANVANLPPLVRNDNRLQEFTATAQPGIQHKLVLFDEAPRLLNTMLGDPPTYELIVPVTFAYLVQGEEGAERDAVWTAGLEALAAVLFPGGRGRTVDGLIDDMTIGDMSRDLRLDDPGAGPVLQFEVTLQMQVTATTPFG